MSLDKAIIFGKEHRKPYYGSKAIDPSCRNHGSDTWELENRTHKNDKRLLALMQREEELKEKIVEEGD